MADQLNAVFKFLVPNHAMQHILLLLRKMKNIRLQDYHGPKGHFQIDEVTIDIDYCTDKPVLQCDAQDVENTFIDDSK